MIGIAQTARRRKLVTVITAGALGLTLGLVVLAYWWGRRGEEAPVAPTRPVPTGVNQQLSGYTYTRSDEGRQVFTIHAAKTVAFKEGGTTVLDDVYVEVFGRTGGRHDILRTRRCDYNAQSGDFFSSGTVQIELNAPNPGKTAEPQSWRSVTLETSQLSFRQQGSQIVSDAPVLFRVGPVSGSARGMIYASKDGWLELKSQVSAEMRRGGAEEVPVRLTASRARYDKDAGQVTLGGPVEISQANRRVRAAHATAVLDSQNRIARVLLDGTVRAFAESSGAQLVASAETLTGEFSPAAEALRRVVAQGSVNVESKRASGSSQLSAQKVEVAFAGKEPQAQDGLASGGVRLTQVSSGASVTSLASLATSRKELTGEGIKFNFREGGQSLKSAETLGQARLLLLPADPQAGERTVAAGEMLMDFDARNRLETMRGLGGTRITLQPAKNAPPNSLPQVTTAERFLATLDPATQTAKTFDQTGNFKFQQGDRNASADRASYQAQNDLLLLTGKPQLWDAEMRARADKIVINVRTDTAEGLGKVQSTHLGRGGGEPTSVLADHVVAERHSQVVHYDGNVRAWRGADVVESAALDVFRSERRVSAGSKVLTSHLQPSGFGEVSKQKGGKQETRPVTIRAEQLEYLDQGHEASYRGAVRLQTENTTLEADRLDAYFSNPPAGGNAELERAVAEGNVKVTQPGRRATGNHAEYFAVDGKVNLRGGPPTLYDTEKGFTSGRSLTFYTHDDKVIVSGGDESPTVYRHRIEQ